MNFPRLVVSVVIIYIFVTGTEMSAISDKRPKNIERGRSFFIDILNSLTEMKVYCLLDHLKKSTRK